MNKVSKRRLAENQVVFRKANEQLKELIDELSNIPKERGVEQYGLDRDEVFHFFCECSDENCRERIELKYDDYEKHHTKNDTFIIKIGHQVPEIEDIIIKTNNYYIVQKHEVPSQSVENLNLTPLNNT